jgi:type IV pilus assembly protein PilW
MTNLFLMKNIKQSMAKPPRNARGFSIIELMVGLMIGLIGTLVIFQVFAVSEQQKRRTTGLSDAQQGGSYALFDLEREVRMAGSGISTLGSLMGCTVNVNLGGTTVMPAATFYAAPFATLNTATKLLPLIITNGDAAAAGSAPDMITVAYGSASAVNTPIGFSGTGDQAQGSMPITNSLGINRGDLLLTALPSGGVCRVWQATGTAPVPAAGQVSVLPTAPFFSVENVAVSGGALWNGSSGTSPGLGAYGPLTQMIDLGANPAISAFGVDVANTNLMMLDLLRGSAPVAIAENVINMQALYGVDAGMLATGVPNGTINWVAPVGGYAASALSPTAANPPLITINAIRAVRIALATRSPERDKEVISPATVTLFADVPAAAITVNLSAEDRRFRYKVYDTVIPIRNMLFQ